MASPRTWKHAWRRVEQLDLVHTLRTALAAVVSLLTARVLRLPETYWAAITTMIVMQSTLGAALTISRQRLAGTAIGALLGALLATFAGKTLPVYGAGIFFCGLTCALLRMERNAFRYAGITLTIVLLIAHAQPAWIIAIHRFLEISLGIAVGVVMTLVWPET